MITIGLGVNPIFPLLGYPVVMFFVPMVSAVSQTIFQGKVAPEMQGRVFAMRGMLSRSMMPLAFLIAGPLADLLFEPLMSAGGALSDTIWQVAGNWPRARHRPDLHPVRGCGPAGQPAFLLEPAIRQSRERTTRCVAG